MTVDMNNDSGEPAKTKSSLLSVYLSSVFISLCFFHSLKNLCQIHCHWEVQKLTWKLFLIESSYSVSELQSSMK